MVGIFTAFSADRIEKEFKAEGDLEGDVVDVALNGGDVTWTLMMR